MRLRVQEAMTAVSAMTAASPASTPPGACTARPASASPAASAVSAATVAPAAGAPDGGAALLAVEGLEVSFPQPGEGWVTVVRGVSLTVRRGECVGLVGESGSGKSLTALALLRLVAPPGRVRGRVLLAGPGGAVDLLALPETAMRAVRGARIGIVFQEPMTALNPFYTIGFQIAEAITAHRPLARRAARAEAVRLLDRVAMPDARRRLDDYPHQLSGGQRQRVLLAMALAGGPDLLLADEPTTALDVTLQAQVLRLIEDLRRDLGLAVLLITHDLAVVAETCDRVAVLYGGQVVEEASVVDLFRAPAHPYARGLLATLPRLGQPGERGRLPVLPGQPVEAAARPAGCAFHPRCPQAMAVCAVEEPPETAPEPGAWLPGGCSAPRRVRCWLHVPAGASRSTVVEVGR
jgi:oligopeptide/dipeptide ABC transporter ATP-binding protein